MERPLRRRAAYSLFAVVALLLGGTQACRKAKDSSKGSPSSQSPREQVVDTATTSVSKPKPVKKNTAPVRPTPVSADARERAKLAAVYRDLQCHYRRNDRTGSQDVFDRYGYGNAAAWAKRWEEIRSADPAWAETIMAEILEAECPVLRR